MKYLLTGLSILTISTNTFGQADETPASESSRYNSVRVGVGIEKSPFIEIGFSRLALTDKGLNSGSFCYYISGQLNKILSGSPSEYAYGGKVGFETSWMIGMWAAEVRYMTTGTNAQWFFTPKAGLSLQGSASLLYGINLPGKSSKLPEIGRHQITLTANLSRRLIKDQTSHRSPK